MPVPLEADRQTDQLARVAVITRLAVPVRPGAAPAGPDPQLTPREEDVLGLLAQGYVTKEIAERLSIGSETVRFHLKHVYEKLHVRSRTEALIKYLK